MSPKGAGSEVPRGEVTAEKGSEVEGVQHHTATLPNGWTPSSTTQVPDTDPLESAPAGPSDADSSSSPAPQLGQEMESSRAPETQGPIIGKQFPPPDTISHPEGGRSHLDTPVSPPSEGSRPSGLAPGEVNVITEPLTDANWDLAYGNCDTWTEPYNAITGLGEGMSARWPTGFRFRNKRL